MNKHIKARINELFAREKTFNLYWIGRLADIIIDELVYLGAPRKKACEIYENRRAQYVGREINMEAILKGFGE